ncbi:MAG: T9SS type B sorting domain-containing protein [Bacteroidota bacterium]|jgi:gliding motility-associated-like protein
MKRAELTRKIISILIFFIESTAVNSKSEPITKLQFNIKNPFDYNFFVENKGQFLSVEKEIGERIFFYTKIAENNIYFLKTGVFIRKQGTAPDKNRKIKICEEERLGKPNQFTDFKLRFENIDLFPKASNEAGENFYFNYSGLEMNKLDGVQVKAYKAITYSDSAGLNKINLVFDQKSGAILFSAFKNKIHVAKSLLFSFETLCEVSTSENVLAVSNTKMWISLIGNKIKNVSKNNIKIDQTSVQENDLKNNNSILSITFHGNNSNGSPYDVDYDNQGNIYAYGGIYPYEERKFDSIGNLLWSHVTSLFGPYTYYGDFAVDKKSGSSYIFECWNFASRAVKLNSNGMQIGYHAGSTQLQEIYRVLLNECTGQIILAGGAQSTNTAIIDTNFTNINYINFFSSNNIGHDFCMLASDREGFVYFATTGLQGIPFDNVLVQAPAATLIPLNYIVFDRYHFLESGSIEYIHNNNNRAGYNGLAAGNKYLYSTDGRLLQKWNKNSGNLIDSFVLSQNPFRFGGIDVNSCEDIFVSNGNSLLQLDSLLNIVQQYNMPDTIYDVKVNDHGIIYACGKNFITSINMPSNNCMAFESFVDITSCIQNGSATIFVNGGIPPYNYNWSPQVTNINYASSLPPGSYTVIVSDNSCPQLKHYDTILFTVSSKPDLKIISLDTICEGNQIVITTNQPGNFLWSTGDTTQTLILVPDSTLEIVLWFTDSNGCKDTATKKIMISEKPEINISGKDSICLGETTIISADGAVLFLWNTGEVENEISVSPDKSSYYFVVGSNGTCINIDSFYVYVSPKPKINVSINSQENLTFSLTVTTQDSFKWTEGNGIFCDTCTFLNITVEETDTFCAEAKNILGCKASSCVVIHIPTLYIPDAFTPNDDGINDYFIPYTKDLEKYNLTIYDRWGEKLFETLKTEEGWNGIYQGKILPGDVYVYLIRFQRNGETSLQTKTGKVTLIR